VRDVKQAGYHEIRVNLVKVSLVLMLRFFVFFVNNWNSIMSCLIIEMDNVKNWSN
jgi:hypothetical protein